MKHILECHLCRMTFESDTLIIPLHGKNFSEERVIDQSTLVCMGSRRIAKARFVACPTCTLYGRRGDCATCHGAFAIMKEVNVVFQVMLLQSNGVAMWAQYSEDQARREIEALEWLTWEEALGLLFEGKMINVNASTMLRMIKPEEAEEETTT